MGQTAAAATDDAAEPRLAVRDLSVQRGDRVLITALNFALAAGEGVHLLGANGAGKTSLLRVLAGIAPALTGDFHIAADCRVIYLGHALGLKPELTVEENLAFLLQLSGQAARRSYADALQAVGLARYFDARVGSLSAGQKRRVGLARLLIEPAGLWLLDEPFAALDVKAAAWLCQQIDAFVDQGGTVLLTSHQPVATAKPLRELVLGARPC
ncbi:cytochrome c biogenesis heme-transporting ATPase CcmA [Permianibacter sp. IMCC34836]|uniref:cytochrome c biogenesis heme-transporting ATPase CcmA n=1 Tax=Permianibacter fluminis TaxID=2738515 RepID=UPI001553D661|nr:cytochrome c biogenesis heme-transporting ATPase CcmA [Permianibacter fluminis]NQD38220.1 cytochrome c biogenesis heme-transporting ATPase CcmA [Permianibacter fluminis]